MLKCGIAGCQNKYRARGFCWTHRPKALPVVLGCKTEGCNSPHEAKGYCKNHYRVWRRAEKLDPPREKEYLKRYSRTLEGRFTSLKRAVKLSGAASDITREIHAELLKSPCAYCGGALNETGHGLDRMSPALGYVQDNVVTCCYTCNKIKNNLLTHAEMLVAMKAVVAYRQQEGGSCGA